MTTHSRLKAAAGMQVDGAPCDASVCGDSANRSKSSVAADARRPLLLHSVDGLGNHLVDTDLPFELRVLEAALDLAGRCFGDEVAELEKQGLPMLDSIAKRVLHTP